MGRKAASRTRLGGRRRGGPATRPPRRRRRPRARGLPAPLRPLGPIPYTLLFTPIPYALLLTLVPYTLYPLPHYPISYTLLLTPIPYTPCPISYTLLLTPILTLYRSGSASVQGRAPCASSQTQGASSAASTENGSKVRHESGSKVRPAPAIAAWDQEEARASHSWALAVTPTSYTLNPTP